MTSRYWQHRTPLCCPKGHVMGWLGLVYWVCATCHTIYVQVPPGTGPYEVDDPRLS